MQHQAVISSPAMMAQFHYSNRRGTRPMKAKNPSLSLRSGCSLCSADELVHLYSHGSYLDVVM
jgi:hypothetical protein